MVKEMKELNIMAKTENSAKDGVVSESESEMSTMSNKGKTWERNTSDISDFGKSDNKSIDKKSVQDKPNSKSAIASDKSPSSSFRHLMMMISVQRGGRKICGRTPRIKNSGKLAKKLFKMGPPAKSGLAIVRP